MRVAVGAVLLVFGVLTSLSAASLNARPQPADVDPARRAGRFVGGAICSLTPLVIGVLLLTGREQAKRRRRRVRDEDDRPRRRAGDEGDDRPGGRRPEGHPGPHDGA